MIWSEKCRNAEALRTQSSGPRISSALSASPRFKISATEEVEDDGVPFADKMEGLTRDLATQFHESGKLQAAIRDDMQKLGFALPEVAE